MNSLEICCTDGSADTRVWGYVLVEDPFIRVNSLGYDTTWERDHLRSLPLTARSRVASSTA